jgi:ribosomal protein L11 methyltransferase
MREIVVRVAPDGVEPVLDELLLIAPYGVFEDAGEGEVELRLRGAADELPSTDRVTELAGEWLRGIEEREVPDDWSERRALDYEPVEIADRVAIRPIWAPPPSDPDMIDLVIAEVAFGTGAHPTTRHCVEILLGLEPEGPLADLGCGSGILAIVAALLGWSPITALDNDERAVEATRVNAAANGVQLEPRVADLLREDPPSARTIVANIPAQVHLQIAERMADPPDTLVAAALRLDNVDPVIAAYAGRGLVERSRQTDGAWVTLELRVQPETPRVRLVDAGA